MGGECLFKNPHSRKIRRENGFEGGGFLRTVSTVKRDRKRKGEVEDWVLEGRRREKKV